MNFSNPILICDENEDFRLLLRDMLTRNGFFHVLEAGSNNEIIHLLREKKDYLVLIDQKSLTREVKENLRHQKNFIVFADSQDLRTAITATQLGVSHVMSYPVRSRKLIERINSLL